MIIITIGIIITLKGGEREHAIMLERKKLSIHNTVVYHITD